MIDNAKAASIARLTFTRIQEVVRLEGGDASEEMAVLIWLAAILISERYRDEGYETLVDAVAKQTMNLLAVDRANWAN